jgi:hypothetical protein
MRRRAVPNSTWGHRLAWNCPRLNTFALSQVELTPRYGIPQMQPCHYVPDALFPWEERSKYKGHGAIHFYCEDAYLNSIWDSAAKYPVPSVVKRAGVALSPDYSVFTDWPMALNLWNVYRSRLLGALWQSHGIHVVPSLMWGETLTQGSYLFDGLPTGGVFAISTGHAQGEDEDVFKDFYQAAIATVKPSLVLVYGHGLNPWMEEQGCEIKRFKSRRTEIFEARQRAV